MMVPPREARETDEELAKRSVVITNLEGPVVEPFEVPPTADGKFDRMAYQREYNRRWRARKRAEMEQK